MLQKATAADTRTVMIVEDDPDMRALLCRHIEGAGFHVIAHESASDAREVVEQKAFDAVILDKHMPGIDGLDFLVFLHGRYPAVPVLVITAFGGRVTEQDALARGAATYLEKPFRLDDLVIVLRRLLRESTPP